MCEGCTVYTSVYVCFGLRVVYRVYTFESSMYSMVPIFTFKCFIYGVYLLNSVTGFEFLGIGIENLSMQSFSLGARREHRKIYFRVLKYRKAHNYIMTFLEYSNCIRIFMTALKYLIVI